MLVNSLRMCKGASEKSMVSLVIPNYESIPKMVDHLVEMKKEYKDPLYEGEYIWEAIDEAAKLIRGMVFQDTDKENIGLIVYCGYIDSGNEVKKVFHTFPTPRSGKIGESSNYHEVYLDQRFKMDILNNNEWFVEALGRI